MSTPSAAEAARSASRGTGNSTPSQRGGNRGRSTGSSQDRQQAPQLKKFTGKEEGLGDEFVYQHTDGREASDQYASTTEEIIRYAATRFKMGSEVGRCLADNKKVIIADAVRPIGTGTPPVFDQLDITVFSLEARKVSERRLTLDDSLGGAYALITGQCSKPILEKVSSQHGYAVVHEVRDPIGLLKLLKLVMSNYNSRKYRPISIIEISKIDLASQAPGMTLSVYLEKFRTQLDVLKSIGADMCKHSGMIQDELSKTGVDFAGASADQLDAASVIAVNRFEGALFLAGSDRQRYGPLAQDLANDFNKGIDSYPLSLSVAYDLMLFDTRAQHQRPLSQGSPGMAFSTVTDPGRSTTGVIRGVTPGTNAQPNPRPDVTCHRCFRTGHFLNKCMEVTHADGHVLCTVVEDDNVNGMAMAHLGLEESDDAVREADGGTSDGFCFLHDGGDVIEKCFDGQIFEQHMAHTGCTVSPHWILLDNQSTVDVFCNKALLKNIRRASRSCRISCNAGVVEVSMVGDLPGYPAPVWYHPNGIANILSLHLVNKHCRVTYDSHELGQAFHVTKGDGTMRDFNPSSSGLHYCECLHQYPVP
jgi:hypothetical protein